MNQQQQQYRGNNQNQSSWNGGNQGQGNNFRRVNNGYQQNNQPAATPLAMTMAEKLLTEFGKKYNFAVYDNGVNTNEVFEVIKRTCFPAKQRNATNEQLVVFLTVAKQYNLNPFTKEIYAYPDKSGGIVPIVGVIGWASIINNHEQLGGMKFNYSDEKVELVLNGRPTGKFAHEWIECELFRNDRSMPTVIREYFAEVYKDTDPWNAMPTRMHRHKTLIQCARYAFGLSGIYDQEDGEVMIDPNALEGEYTEQTSAPAAQAEQQIVQAEKHRDQQDQQQTQEQHHGQTYEHGEAQEQQHQGQQEQQQTQQQQTNNSGKPFMDEGRFQNNFDKAFKLITQGTKTADQLIQQLTTNYSMTPEQIAMIKQLEAQAWAI